MNTYSLNLTQKSIASLYVAMIIIALFIHNPFGGYEVKQENPLYASGVHMIPCTKQEKDNHRAELEAVRKIGVKITENEEDTQAYIDSSVEECMKSIPYEITAHFSEWRSTNPMLPWFGNISNLLKLIFAISIVLGVMFYIFKNQEQ